MCVGMFVLVFCVGCKTSYVLFGHEINICRCGVEQLERIDITKLHIFCFCDAEQSLYTSCVLNLAMCLVGLSAPAVAVCLLLLLSVCFVGQCL